MTIVEDDQKAPFSIATTPRCRRRRYSFPWTALFLPLMRTLYRWVLSNEVSILYLKSLVWLNLGLNPGLPDHWRTLMAMKGTRHSSNSRSGASASVVVYGQTLWRGGVLPVYWVLFGSPTQDCGWLFRLH